MIARSTFAVICLVVLCSGNLMAEVPEKMNYQGRLMDNTGVLLTGSFDLTIRVYNDSIGGFPVYEETHSSVPVDSGLFNVLIGGKSPVIPFDANVFSGPDRYLGVQVGADPELTPRTRLVTSPYAFRTGTVDGATGGTVGGNLQVDGLVRSTSGGFAFPDNSVQTSAAQSVPVARTDWMSPFWQNASGFELYTQLAVYNTANVSCSVTVSFYSNTGALAAECGTTLSANSVWQVGSSTALTNPCVTNDGYGHLEITAAEPVAVWGVIYKFSNGFTEFNMGVPLMFYAP